MNSHLPHDAPLARSLERPRPRLSTSKTLLRFLTCSSVDDGKSTLIGRLLYDTGALTDDQRDALARDSKRSVNTGVGGLDFSLVVDGLRAEREQGITIDVAYRRFETPRRTFIIADAPGHEQYTRNMATAASTSEAAVVLVDASKGIVAQTCRHSYIAALVGVRHFIIAVNKMDAAQYDETTFLRIEEAYRAFATTLGIMVAAIVPLSALAGENVSSRSELMKWYRGPTLLNALETLEFSAESMTRPMRFPVQMVIRASPDFRGYAGTVASGSVFTGQDIVVMPSGRPSRIARIVTSDGDLEQASAGTPVVLTLTKPLDIGRGDLIATAAARPGITDQFTAHLVWFADKPMLPGHGYLLRIGPLLVGCRITNLKYKIDPLDLSHSAGKQLRMNEIAFCDIAVDDRIPFDPFDANPETGRFVIVDRMTNATVGCGMIASALRRAQNIHWQPSAIDKHARSALKGQRPCILWFTGLPGSGKSTITNLVERELINRGRHTYLLDGDNIRHGLSKDLGFTVEDRIENIRRIAECAKLFVDAGLIVIAAFISPFREERQMARRLVAEGEFIEIYVNTPLEVCERRDPKGLYKKARSGQLPNFTGIDSPYEPPATPELILNAGAKTAADLAGEVIALLESQNYLG